jgi:cytochrome c peroxidase
MKRSARQFATVQLVAGTVAVALGVIAARRAPDPTSEDRIRAVLIARFDSLSQSFDRLEKVFRASNAGSAATLLSEFRVARREFKRAEMLLEYFGGTAGAVLNGREPVGADEPGEVLLPGQDTITGFMAVERTLFPSVDTTLFLEAARHANLMRRTVDQLRAVAGSLRADESYIFDAARLELVRITALGLGGFDTPDSPDRGREAAAALEGIRDALRAVVDPSNDAQRERRALTDRQLTRAIEYLGTADDPNQIDYVAAIAEYVVPAARALNAERRARGLSLPSTVRAWRETADFIFDRAAFDPHAYAAPFSAAPTREMIALGRQLFFESALSGAKDRSCASCHDPAVAFAEDRARTRTIDNAHASVARNTPTLINSAFQPALFFDQRVLTVEEQVVQVIGSQNEMRGDIDSAVTRLAENATYRSRFRSVFGPADSIITTRRVRTALAAYVRSLVATNSRFDRAMRGNPRVLSATERKGFNLFMGKGNCASCHFLPFFSGTRPPDYTIGESEVLGVPSAPDTINANIDPDLGRGGIDGMPANNHAFKAMTLRNVAITPPYMHNGVYKTLEEVMDFYNRGGGAGIGIELPNATLSARPLGLTHEEQQAIIAFLRTLSDTVGTTQRPAPSPFRRRGMHSGYKASDRTNDRSK